MRKTIVILIALFCAIQGYSQNPYASIGKKADVLNIDGSVHKNYFKQDSIVQMGSVLLNVNTGKIIHILPKDSIFKKPEAETTGRFMSIDPLAEKYYDISPYAFVMNNPIKYYDPDGRIVVDANGNVVVTTKDNVVRPSGAEPISNTVNGITTIVEVEYSYQSANIYTNDGTAISAELVVGETTQTTTVMNDETGELISRETITGTTSENVDCTTNCHGLTFANGTVRVGDSDVANILAGDGYKKSKKKKATAVLFFPSNSNETNHSAKINPDRTYDSNNGDEATIYNSTLNVARRGRNVDPSKDKFVRNKKGNRKVNTNAGNANQGRRVITDTKQIQTFLNQLGKK
ncbi:MAG: hypothetical protein ACJAWV_001810 [Flammeovirgaceae bacterium]|jgi:hypothetical protein